MRLYDSHSWVLYTPTMPSLAILSSLDAVIQSVGCLMHAYKCLLCFTYKCTVQSCAFPTTVSLWQACSKARLFSSTWRCSTDTCLGRVTLPNCMSPEKSDIWAVVLESENLQMATHSVGLFSLICLLYHIVT